MRSIATLSLALLTIGAAPPPQDGRSLRDQDRLDQRLAGFVEGPAQACVQQRDLKSSSTFGDTVLYRASPARFYKMELSDGCAPITQDDSLVSANPTTSTCRGDVVRVVHRRSGQQTGSCTIARFVPYTRN